MNYRKYYQDLAQYRYMLGEIEELDEFLIAA